MTLDEVFHYIVVLTTEPRFDRRYLFLRDSEFTFSWFNAIYDKDPHRSFNLSQQAIIQDFVDSDADNILVMEDDADYRHGHLLDTVMQELPDDWDMLYLGANVKPHDNIKCWEWHSEHLARIYNAYCTHAVAYRRPVARYIAEHYKAQQMYDAFLDEQVLHRFKAYITVPFMSFQRPTMSSLWDRTVDYTDTFQVSEYLLMQSK